MGKFRAAAPEGTLEEFAGFLDFCARGTADKEALDRLKADAIIEATGTGHQLTQSGRDLKEAIGLAPETFKGVSVGSPAEGHSLDDLLGDVSETRIFWGAKPDFGLNYSQLKAIPVKTFARQMSGENKNKVKQMILSTLASASSKGKLQDMPMKISKKSCVYERKTESKSPVAVALCLEQACADRSCPDRVIIEVIVEV